MAKFLLHLQQEGEGCDYTIGCGHALEKFEAFSQDEITNKVKDIIEDYGRDRIESVHFYEITDNNAQLDIDGMFAADDAAEKRRGIENNEKQELDMLEALRKKYPNV